MTEIAPVSAEPLAFEIALPPFDLFGGDAQTVHALFNDRCAACHGEDGMRTDLALPVVYRVDVGVDFGSGMFG